MAPEPERPPAWAECQLHAAIGDFLPFASYRVQLVHFATGVPWRVRVLRNDDAAYVLVGETRHCREEDAAVMMDYACARLQQRPANEARVVLSAEFHAP